MSKGLSVAMLAHAQLGLTKFAACIRIERRDGQVFCFTNHDQPIEFNLGLVTNDETYEPYGFNLTDVVSSLNLEVGNFTAEGALRSESITEDELRAGYWDHAQFWRFLVNWADLTQGPCYQRVGNLGEVSVNRSHFVAEMLGLSQGLRNSIGAVTTPTCRAVFGGPECGVDLGPLTVTGTIATMDTDFYTWTDPARTEGNIYPGGILTITEPGDPMEGMSFEIRSQADDVFVNQVAFPYDAAGLAYSMHRGCDKLLATCRDTFDNVVNFRGEPYVQGIDMYVQVGRQT